MNLDQTIELFYETTKNHKLDILINNEECVYLSYKENAASYNATILITNEILTVYSDLGCYVFNSNEELIYIIEEIDLDKFAENCISVDINFPIYVFNFKTFEKSVLKIANNYCAEKELSESTKKALISDIKFSLDEDYIINTKDECFDFVKSYEFDYSTGTFMLPNINKIKIGNYTMNFIWNCYAIYEALKLYAKKKKIQIKNV